MCRIYFQNSIEQIFWLVIKRKSQLLLFTLTVVLFYSNIFLSHDSVNRRNSATWSGDLDFLLYSLSFFLSKFSSPQWALYCYIKITERKPQQSDDTHEQQLGNSGKEKLVFNRKEHCIVGLRVMALPYLNLHSFTLPPWGNTFGCIDMYGKATIKLLWFVASIDTLLGDSWAQYLVSVLFNTAWYSCSIRVTMEDKAGFLLHVID